MEKDIIYVNDFTVNEIFSDPDIYINTYFYDSEALGNSECPLNKYLTYNSHSAQAVSSLKLNHARKRAVNVAVNPGKSFWKKHLYLKMILIFRAKWAYLYVNVAGHTQQY